MEAEMAHPLDRNTTIAELNRAFQPLFCVSGIHGEEIRYRVYNLSGDTVLSVFGIELSSVLDSEHLRMEIEELVLF